MDNNKIALQNSKQSLGRTPVSSRKPYIALSDDELASVSGGVGDKDGMVTFSYKRGDTFTSGNYIFVVTIDYSGNGEGDVYLERFDITTIQIISGQGTIVTKKASALANTDKYDVGSHIQNF